MPSNLPKIASVLLSVSALAFMGMAVASYFGRPDPAAEISSPELADYHFESPPTTTGSWTVTPNVGSDLTPTTYPNAYAAIVGTYKKENGRVKAAATEASSLTSKLRTRIEAVRAEQQEDLAAIDRRIADLQQRNAHANSQLQERSQEVQKLTVDTLAIRGETARRRGDVIRLKHELEELRTDRFRLEELRRVLTDRLVRLELENQSIDLRAAEIRKTTGQ